MKKFFQYITKHVMRFMNYVMNDHLGAYATSSAYFLILSFIPFILLLMTSIQFTPLTKGFVSDVILSVTPNGFHSLLTGIINEVYSKSVAVVPITAILALWSSGKGLQAITNGLNVIYETREDRNYFIMRFRSILYTVMFIVVIMATLISLVFGNRIQSLLWTHLPLLAKITAWIINMRMMIVFFVLVVVFTCIFTIIPNHKLQFRTQIPGATFSAVAWLVCSYGFSVYIDSVDGASVMYGSLTAIVMIMLWLYFCMYLLLAGAEINVMIAEKRGIDYAIPKHVKNPDAFKEFIGRVLWVKRKVWQGISWGVNWIWKIFCGKGGK
ncbi:MAG: YihY/virulence factor BrkB family protein [Lachnospiraceae bacterium]|nr:YihY/virulence factor BrkB family protein [Lachnospiraceae bacterium]MDD3615070.1 YihY/virulence factor BrkB family protein [Lachnospiraceae bacterium]